MIAREDLHRLVDELSEEELEPAGRLLEFLRNRARGEAKEIVLTVEPGRVYKIVSPRFARPGDAAQFQVEVMASDQPKKKRHAKV